MSVVVSMEEAGPSRQRLEIEVPGAAVEAETARVIGDLRRKARLPGFRQGKVPTGVIRQRFDEEIRRELVDRLVPRYWKQAADERQLDALTAPQLDDVELEPGESLRFVATVEVRPEITVGDLDGFDLPELALEATDEDVDRALEDLRRDVADWVPAEREAARGDLVSAELVEIDAAGEPRGEPDTVELEIGDPKVWEELSLALTGLAAGAETTFSRREGEGPEAVERSFRARVVAVKERDLPPLDDDLAARIGDYDSIDELRDEVRSSLAEARRRERLRRRESALLEQLRERHPIVLPTGVVDEEIEELAQEYAQDLARRGVDVERAGIDWNQVREQARPQAERRVHDRLLLDAVAEAQGVEVTEAEFEATLANLARSQRTSTVALRQALERGGRLGALRQRLRREKVVRGLLGEKGLAGGEEGAAGSAAEDGASATGAPSAGDESQD